MPIKFRVQVCEIRAAALFASTDESRFVLNGVHFEVGKQNPILVSSDGRRLCTIETACDQDLDNKGPESKLTISTGFLLPLCAFAKSSTAFVEIEFHPPKRVLFYLKDCVVDSEAGAVVEGEFPNWRQVVPGGEKGPVGSIGFAGEYITDFFKAAKLLGCEIPILRMNLFSDVSAIEINIDSKPNFYGVLMPVKPDEGKDFQPEFLLKGESRNPKAGPLDGTTVTIQGDDIEPVTISGKAFSKLAKSKAA